VVSRRDATAGAWRCVAALPGSARLKAPDPAAATVGPVYTGVSASVQQCA
jgi:hypothetical protein